MLCKHLDKILHILSLKFYSEIEIRAWPYYFFGKEVDLQDYFKAE